MDTDSTKIVKIKEGITKALKQFSEIQKIKEEDNFVQEKVNQVSEQKMEFRKFIDGSITHVLKISTYSGDLIVFAECCGDKSISDDEILELLRSMLNDSREQKKNAESLRNQLNTVTNTLNKITSEIAEYYKTKEDLPDKINETEKKKGSAETATKCGLLTVGAGAAVALAAAPFTGGASLVAEVFVLGGALSIFGGATVSGVSNAIAKASSTENANLNNELKLSKFLQTMQGNIRDINRNISCCESYWDMEIIAIESIIGKLEYNDKNEKRMVITIAKAVTAGAESIREDAKDYGASLRYALSKDSISQ